MTDRKTAAELRATAEAATGYDRMVLLHLAAVEEEREAAMDPTARPCRDCGNDGTKLGCNEAACACGHMCIMHATGGACRVDDCSCTRFARRCTHDGIGLPGCRLCDPRVVVPVGGEPISAREHARRRGSLGGADAQALEGALAMTEKERDAAIARAEKAEAALAKINAIRDSIIGAQNINWSEHIYPLVAALNEAGFQGTPHKVARENLGTLIEQVKAAEARAEAAEKRVAELEPYRAKVESWRTECGFTCTTCGKRDNDVTQCDACAHAAGIREGLERAAVLIETTCNRDAPYAVVAIRAMKAEVK